LTAADLRVTVAQVAVTEHFTRPLLPVLAPLRCARQSSVPAFKNLGRGVF
jgi:hypothetical protein